MLEAQEGEGATGAAAKAARGGRGIRRSRGWTRRVRRVEHPAERPVGRPPGSTALVRHVPDVEMREFFTTPMNYMWLDLLAPIFAQELAYYERIGMLAAASALINTAPASTYLQKRRGSEHAKARRMAQDVHAVMRWCAEALHRCNQRLLPPSMAARSVAYLGHKASNYVWSNDGGLISKPAAISLVHNMMKVRPPPAYEQSLRVVFYVYDQVYRNLEKRHSKKGGTRVQRIDGAGEARSGTALTKEYERVIFINYFRVPVPVALPALTQPDVDELRRVGPFTRSYDEIYSMLQPTRVKQMLYDWCHHFGAQIFHVAALNGCAPSGLPPAQLARALLARPDVDPGGRTYLEIGKPVINCNTQSYEDAEKYNLAMEQHALSALMEAKRLQGDDGLSPEASVEDAIFFGLGDGAAFNLEEGHVKHKPIRWRNWISLKGPFHSEAHQHFASHETFGPALTIWAANVLERDIDTMCQTLDKGEYLLYREFAAELTVGIYCFLVLDAVHPPPAMLLRNLKAYSKLVGRNAGAKVLVKWLRYGGVPGMAWLYCQRVSRGSGLLGLDSYMYHMCRATCHKTNYVTYCAQHLATHAAMHPKLRTVAEAMMSISALGKKGSNMGADRAQEAVNKIQEQRDGLGGDIDSKLHMGPELSVLLHGTHAYDEAMGSDVLKCRDPLRPSLLNGAMRIRDELRKLLPTDLTQPDDHNPFWHTGSQANMFTGDIMLHRPWKHIWRVADGVAQGKGAPGGGGRRAAERWQAQIARFLSQHMRKNDS